jgi:hypothetical protein
VQSNYGDTAQTGFAEVAFNTTVPEPAALTIVAIGILGIAAVKRRQRRR